LATGGVAAPAGGRRGGAREISSHFPDEWEANERRMLTPLLIK